MVKRDPDDIISALSKNLKKDRPQILRITLKRACPHFNQNGKILHKKLWKQKKNQGRLLANEKPNQSWPLYVRYKENTEGKETPENENERLRLNCGIKQGRANGFINSLLGIFRASFYKKQNLEKEKVAKGPSKNDPNSKSTKRKQEKNKKNRQRRQKRKQILSSLKKEKNRQANVKKVNEETVNASEEKVN